MDSSTTPSDERAADAGHVVTRRTVARGMAWTVPVAVVVVAAPAFAASPACVRSTVALSPTSTPVTALTFLPSGVTATVAYAATNGDGTPRADSTPGETGEVHPTDYTPSWNYLKMHLPKSLHEGQTITMTITFSQPVTNLSLEITDIDQATDSWFDNLIVNTPGYLADPAVNVIGSGTVSDPFLSKVDGGISSDRGDLGLSWAGPLSVVQLTYRAGITGGSEIGEHIGVGQIAFGC